MFIEFSRSIFFWRWEGGGGRAASITDGPFIRINTGVTFIFTLGSLFSCGETSTVQLDMSKIPSKLKIPYEQLQLLSRLGQVGYFFNSCRYFQTFANTNWYSF